MSISYKMERMYIERNDKTNMAEYKTIRGIWVKGKQEFFVPFLKISIVWNYFNLKSNEKEIFKNICKNM